MRPAAAALLLFLLAATEAAAQCLPSTIPPEEAPPCTRRYPSWSGELASLGGNALLGGVTSGLMQELRGGSFRSGFMRGVMGGSVIYAGKRIAVERFETAGLMGRQVAAVGGSMVRNAGEGIPGFDRLILPVGVGRLEFDRPARRLQLTPDLTALGYTLWAISEDELAIDWSKTFSSGTPVFSTDNRILVVDGDSTHAAGVTNSGVIYLAGIPGVGRTVARRQFEHERVHVLQEDQLFITLTDPIEELLLAQLPYLGRHARRVDINLSTQLLEHLGKWFPKHLERPWETEAIFHSR